MPASPVDTSAQTIDEYFSKKIKTVIHLNSAEEKDEAPTRYIQSAQFFMELIGTFFTQKKTQGKIIIDSDVGFELKTKCIIGAQIRLRYGLKLSILDFRVDGQGRKIDFTRRNVVGPQRISSAIPITSRSFDLRTMHASTLESIWREALDALI